MLEIRNFSAGYEGKPVLQDISLSIPRGAVTVIVGPNGCGKSTLLKALAGILPAAGSAVLDGRELSTLDRRHPVPSGWMSRTFWDFPAGNWQKKWPFFRKTGQFRKSP